MAKTLEECLEFLETLALREEKTILSLRESIVLFVQGTFNNNDPVSIGALGMSIKCCEIAIKIREFLGETE